MRTVENNIIKNYLELNKVINSVSDKKLYKEIAPNYRGVIEFKGGGCELECKYFTYGGKYYIRSVAWSFEAERWTLVMRSLINNLVDCKIMRVNNKFLK